MAELLKYADKLFPLIIGGVICIGVTVLFMYMIIRMVKEISERPKTPWEFPAITIRKAQHEWAKEYLKQKEEEKKNKD